MNQKARTETIEVLLNPEEVTTLDSVRAGLGRSPFLRNLLHLAARTHGMPPSAPKESRHCRGAGRAASRASAGGVMRRNL